MVLLLPKKEKAFGRRWKEIEYPHCFVLCKKHSYDPKSFDSESDAESVAGDIHEECSTNGGHGKYFVTAPLSLIMGEAKSKDR